MGLRIRTNFASLNAQRQLTNSSSEVQGSYEKLASGQRINKAADDAASLAISENMRAQLKSISQAKRNASDGVSLIQVAEGSMNEVSNIIVRLRELSIQAASDTVSNEERFLSNKEYGELVSEIERITNASEFNGVQLLKGGNADGDLEKLTLHVGPGDGFVENTDTIDIDIQGMKLDPFEDLGLNREAEIGPLESDDSDFTREAAAEKLTTLDNALVKINGIRSTLGAKQNRLGSTISNLSIAYENVSAARSRIRDVDFAEETANLTKSRILQQSGVSVLAQANQGPEMALSLLR